MTSSESRHLEVPKQLSPGAGVATLNGLVNLIWQIEED